MTLRESKERIKVDIPAVFIALHHPKTPWYAKIVAGFTIAYALSPIDFIPDFVPFLGYLDDLILLPLLASLVIHLIPKPIFEECREKSRGLWENGKPKKWYYAIPILAIWALVICLAIKALSRFHS